VIEFADAKILVVGDAMMDVYHFGRVERVSPEAPVPIFIEERQKGRPGGAGNVASNVVSLGLQAESVMYKGPMITKKIRYMAGHHLMFRIDQDQIQTPTPGQIAEIARLLPEVQAVIVSDYGKGFVTRELIETVTALKIPVVVDPKGDCWQKYDGATYIIPNAQEWRQVCLSGRMCEVDNIIVKQGELGAQIISKSKNIQVPTNPAKVYDVTGAGDTFIAAFTCALVSGYDILNCVKIANRAAGIVVGKLGTSECTLAELNNEHDMSHHAQLRNSLLA
jgi:rfaE bifunctional protein kinase chain/domain